MDKEVARELAALRDRCDELVDRGDNVIAALKAWQEALNSVWKMAEASSAQNIALAAICSALLAEIALLHPDPSAKVGVLASGLLGTAEAVARAAGEHAALTAPISEMIDRVIGVAEAHLAPK